MLVRDQTGKIDTMILRSGVDYCYIIPRLDGKIVLGGIKDNGDT
jgi:D-amino-acid oxidase